MKEKKTIKQLIVVISLIGLSLVGLGTFFMVKDLKHKKESYKVTVHITDVEQVGEDNYLYYVDYTAGGKEYSHVVYKPSNDKNAHPGGSEKAHADKDNPYNLRRIYGPVIVIFLYIMGIAVTAAGLSVCIKEIKKKKMDKSHYVYAEIFDVCVDYSVAVNEICPFVIKCRYNDPETGKEIIFTSGHCYDDPGQVYSPGEQIKVYVEDSTYENYLVDLEKFESLGLG